MRRLPAILVFVLVASPLLAQWATLPKGRIGVGEKTIVVEVARSRQEQAKGLMYRDSLPEDEGMIFLDEKPTTLSFWMKNTRIPLSIAYIDERSVIFQIEDMKPFSETTIASIRPGVAALEMNRGWFAKNGIAVGATVDLSALAEAGLWPPKDGDK